MTNRSNRRRISTHWLITEIKKKAFGILIITSSMSLTCLQLSLTVILTQTLLRLQFFQPSGRGDSTERHIDSQFRGVSHLKCSICLTITIVLMFFWGELFCNVLTLHPCHLWVAAQVQLLQDEQEDGESGTTVRETVLLPHFDFPSPLFASFPLVPLLLRSLLHLFSFLSEPEEAR